LLSTRAGLYVMEQLPSLMSNVRELAPHFSAALDTLAKRYPMVSSTRGVGLMRALELTVDAQPVVEGALKQGLLVNRTAERVVRMLPPLTVSKSEIDEAIAVLDGVLANVTPEVTT
jgi:acetylornithine/succinyldiaminopimelate/putrescine aminotransferase